MRALLLRPVIAGVLLLGAGLLLPGQASAAPRILGGGTVPVTSVPYVAAITLDNRDGSTENCSAAIIDATRVLTNAHCLDSPGLDSATAPAVGRVRVGSEAAEPLALSAGGQERTIASTRVHPGHLPNATIVTPDDIAVVTVSQPFDLSGPRAQAIPIVAPGAYPAGGATLVQAGYGKQSPAADPDHLLHGRQATITAGAECGPTNAVQLCYTAPPSAGCPGDSGGPIVVGGILVGINASGECAAGATGVAASLAAGEIRQFVDGSASPPLAPVSATTASISAIARAGSTATCTAGAWSNAPTFVYAFQDARDGSVLQLGSAPTYVLKATDVGRPVRCTIAATTAGGTGQQLTGTTPPVIAAPVAPITQAGPSTPATPGAPTVALSLASRLRVRSRQALRITVGSGAAALPRFRLCVAVSRRARIVRSKGALRARTTRCATYGAQAAGASRRITLRVRASSKGAVRVTATLQPEGQATLVRSDRTVRSR